MRQRLDVWLVDHGLAESRQKAQALVMAGRVRVGDRPARKAGEAVPKDAHIEVLPGPAHVGRGALKLKGALEAFGLDPAGRTAVDVGASTGGFTQVLLDGGVRRVYAVDVGRAQLHERLHRDPRVVVRDEVNARALGADHVPEACDLATVDVSFISVLKVLPAVRTVLASHADVLVLVKPQFEVGRGQVGPGGLVTDPAHHLRCLLVVALGAQQLGYVVRAACASPITGAEGNREFFLHLHRGGALTSPEAIDAMMRSAVGVRGDDQNP